MTKVVYECGCEAGGDLISPYCPVHGDPILRDCARMEMCAISKIFGGFPKCYYPEDKIVDGADPKCTVYVPCGMSNRKVFKLCR